MNMYQAQARLKELSQDILGKGDSLTGTEAKAALDEWRQCEATVKAHKQALRFAGGHALDDTSGDPPKGTGGSAFVGKSIHERGTSVVDDGQRLSFTAKMAGGIAAGMVTSDGITSKALACIPSPVRAQKTMLRQLPRTL